MLDNAICLKGAWMAALAARLPVKPHNQCMLPDDVVVTPAVKHHGLLIYKMPIE
ncbi:hypothetical protein [Sphingobium yanoikuyae]|uniref:hypothetical protein n=1 Tax=Sphingobium yanoikuyae TaxID=13690 RepID=UPI0035B07E92